MPWPLICYSHVLQISEKPLLQISTMETNQSEISDIFEVNSTRGLSLDVIKKLPSYKYHSMETMKSSQEINCTICLQVCLCFFFLVRSMLRIPVAGVLKS